MPGILFHFSFISNWNCCTQTVESLIRHHILWRLVWFYTVFPCSTKGMQCFYELIEVYKWQIEHRQEVCIDPNLEPAVDFLFMCALKRLLLWIICIQRKNPLCTELESVRILVILIISVHGCVLRTYADIPKIILTFQRWIICVYMSKYIETWMYSAYVRRYP